MQLCDTRPSHSEGSLYNPYSLAASLDGFFATIPFTMDSQHRITFVGASIEAVLGLRPEKCLGKRWCELGSLASSTDERHQAPTLPLPPQSIVELRDGDGSPRWMNLRLKQPFLGKAALQREFHGLACDVTTDMLERRKLLHRIAKLETENKRLVGATPAAEDRESLVHAISQPLTTITCLCAAGRWQLKESRSSSTEQSQHLEQIEEAAMKAATWLREWARAEPTSAERTPT